MANDTLPLLPNPQHLVDLGAPATQQHAKVNWQIVTGNTAPSEQVGLTPIIPGVYAK